MIKQLKMGFKLLPYCYGVVTNLILLVIMLVIGISAEAHSFELPVKGTDFNAYQNLGGYIILVAGMFVLQMLISLNVPDFMATSPWKKRIQTSVFALMSFVCYFVCYVIIVGLKIMKYSAGTISYEMLIVELLGFPIMILMLNVYMAIALKYFVASTVVFCLLMPVLMSMHGIAYYFGWIQLDGITLAGVIALGVLSLVVGSVLDYLLLKLIYKKPVSKYSQVSSLKKKM